MNIDSVYYLDLVRSIALRLPETVAATSYGSPSFKVRDKLFARIKEDGKTLAIFTVERDKWIEAKPAVFFITDHYLNYPMMLVNLKKADKKELAQLIRASWKLRASKTVLKTYPEV